MIILLILITIAWMALLGYISWLSSAYISSNRLLRVLVAIAIYFFINMVLAAIPK